MTQHEAKRAVIELVLDAPDTVEGIAHRTGSRIETIRKAVGALKDEGKVIESANGWLTTVCRRDDDWAIAPDGGWKIGS